MTAGLRHWLHRRQRPLRYAFLDGLLRTQALTRPELLTKQREDLERIVAYAAADTEHYARSLGPIVARGGWTIADLPVLTKEDVIRHLPDLLARGVDRATAKIGHTGGSTGKPLAFWYDETKHELMRAGMLRSYMMSGWRPGQKIVNFWGARQDTVAGGVFGAGWADFIAAEKTIPAHEYDADRLREWVRVIRSYRPVLLQGYASILTAVARFVVDHRIEMPDTLRGVYSTAEVLYDWQRQLMETAFGCQVFNQYGSREVPNIACECRHGNMHVFTDMVWLESLGDGDEPRLLVTSLTNRLMPFIRYDIGDSARLRDGDCPCGSPFPLMDMGMCRHNDIVRTPGGKSIHPSYFNGLLYGLTQIEQYQFVQEQPERIVLNVVAAAPLAADISAALQERILREVDAGLELQLAYVTEIPRTASGKHRFVISRCADMGSRHDN